MDKKDICLALGFFDSVHIGHRKILLSVERLARKYNASACAMTFKNNIYGIVKQKSKLLYTYEERKQIFASLGIEPLPFEFTKEFGNTDRTAFLNFLLNEYNIKAFVCGKDFTFGKDKAGNVDFLRRFSYEHNIEALIEDEVALNGNKISTTLIKDYLTNCELEFANKALGENYFISGTVIRGMGRGKTMGFPTANVLIPEEKFTIGDGVYSTDTIADGVKYRSITNVGAKPTFFENLPSLETHLIDYEGNLYNKEIKVVFRRFMRHITRFSDKKTLIKQLEEDKKNRCSE